jgi:hypothetical protein
MGYKNITRGREVVMARVHSLVIIRKVAAGLALVLACSGGLSVQAKDGLQKISSIRSFNNVAEKAEMAVVVFYEKDKKKIRADKDLASKVERVERIFSNVSRSFDYKEAEILFLQVDTARRDLQGLLGDYQIGAIPTYMLFKFGEPVKQGDKIAMLTGMASADQIRQFIDTFFKDRIKSIVEEKAKLREKRAEESYYYGWGWGGWGYPYYYWNYPYYGWGYGCGWGRCWW